MLYITNPMTISSEERRTPGKFQRQTSILMWKAYLQRQRRWRLLAVETLFAIVVFLVAIFISKPVFLTPLQAEPDLPLTTSDILSTLQSDTLLGYAPDTEPYTSLMTKAAEFLGFPLLRGATELELNEILYDKLKGTPIKSPVIWVMWKPVIDNKWKFSIRSTERARYVTSSGTEYPNPHLRAGFLAVQVAISKAIVLHVADNADYDVNLVSMPISPLMQQERVSKALSLILMCFTLAFLPAVLETQSLVVGETQDMFKRALRMRNVSYTSMYTSWLVYAYLTALPVCMLGAITMILIFRWIHLLTALLILLAYISVMTMVSLVMAMFHDSAHISCIWTTLFTLLQTHLAELLVHHQYDDLDIALTFVLHICLPPLGLINAFNEFALLSTGHSRSNEGTLFSMLLSWCLLICFYFGLLMLLQRTISNQRAIGGQVSWKSIIFKEAADTTRLHEITPPTQSGTQMVQEVDELVAKSVSLIDVCKNIMGVPVLQNITFDVYRGEYTVMFAEKIQEHMLNTLDDVITGLTLPDNGEVRVLGETMSGTSMPLNILYMMGYCHRSETLVGDLTVEEHFTLFSAICLWYEESSDILEYNHIRYKHLITECNLTSVCHTRVRDLDIYYRAQLCWALAMLLEPRVIVIPNLQNEPTYRAVIIDKIKRYKGHTSIIRFLFSSLEIEYADRMFVFDGKILVLGGTPAFMFFRYGRDYRVRLTLKPSSLDDNPEYYYNLMSERVQAAGGTIRAHLGSLIILRVPALPTRPFAELIKDVTDNADKYGVTSSINISVPDSEEVVRRAIYETRSSQYQIPDNVLHACTSTDDVSKEALKRVTEPKNWKPSRKRCRCHFKYILGKYFRFHTHHKILLTLTFLTAITVGLLLGWSLCSVIFRIDSSEGSNMLESEVLSVENLSPTTNLVLRSDSSSEALSISAAYVMSDTGATKQNIKSMAYVALPAKESLKEYLITRAIDSPQNYVYIYAYGMEVTKNANGKLIILALYSPLNFDHGAAARSLARVYMALIRHYTGQIDATIQVKDDPLALDLSPWMKDLAQPPLLLQFLLILTISHITLLPSKEYGFIRHVQKHAMDFSPILYWTTLYMCDILFILILVITMSAMIVLVMWITAPEAVQEASDVVVLPLLLMLYGAGCVPQAYIFSLGPNLTLNLMAFVIVNTVFGETTILAKLFYGDALHYVMILMELSPQFNMAYAYVKIKQIFLYNTECIKLRSRNLCMSNQFHKCCEKCGVLQECYSKTVIRYLSRKQGILGEIISMIATATFFSFVLLVIEYKVVTILKKLVSEKLYHKETSKNKELSPGVRREINDVRDKKKAIVAPNKKSNLIKVDTFAEYLCVENISRRVTGFYALRNVYFGLGRGEALTITGLIRHGRMDLLDILSGYKIPCEGNVWAMSKWSLCRNPHKYSREVSVSCEKPSLPPWLKLQPALELIAALRGIPEAHVRQEVRDHIEALELMQLADTLLSEIPQSTLTRVHFIAAVIGAPPIIIVDEVTGWQKVSVRRAIYKILFSLRKKGHALIATSATIERQLPVTSRRLAFIVDGTIYDIDSIDNLVHRYSPEGITVVVHLKDEIDVMQMFNKYFTRYYINDTFEVLINVQIVDSNLNWTTIIERMEALQAEFSSHVYSYIVTATAIDYVYNTILGQEEGLSEATGFMFMNLVKKLISSNPKTRPTEDDLRKLKPFEKKYDLTTLKQLPWSVIFQSNDTRR